MDISKPMAGAGQTRPQSRTRTKAETAERVLILNLARTVSATLGRDFFRSLVEHLGTAIGGDCVFVGELTDPLISKLKTVAVFRGHTAAADFTQDLAGTAAQQVLIDGAVAWRTNAKNIFPLDNLLQGIGAETFVGIRLSDASQQVLGLLAVMSSEPLKDVALVKTVLEAFAPRAAAELERKRVDAALRESEERYRNFIAVSSDAMWRIEFERPIPLDLPEEEQIERIYHYGYLAECNDALARLVGASSSEDLVGSTFSSLFSRDDEWVLEELRSTIRSGYGATTFATTPLDREGRKQYRLRTQCGIVEKNELHRIWGTTRDITELKRAELAVEAFERRFREVLEHIHLPAFMLDAAGAITFSNARLRGLLNIADADGAGRNWPDLLQTDEERKPWTEMLERRPDAPQHFEQTIHPRGGKARLIVWDTIKLRNEDGQAAGLAAIGRDITDQKALESRLVRAEKLESIGRLAGGVAHDFNNLLTVIMSHLALLIAQTESHDPIYQRLVELQSVAEECGALSQQLLAIGRKQHLRPELINLNAVIAGEENILRRVAGPDIELMLDMQWSLGLVFADPVQLRRVLANLVANSRDAMPEGGTIVITTMNVEPRDPTLPDELPEGQYVRLTVSDTGTGLTAEVKEHMFDPFFTTKASGRGTGLGLPTVYGIVAQSGGHISARGEPGDGTIVEILLPRRDENLVIGGSDGD